MSIHSKPIAACEEGRGTDWSVKQKFRHASFQFTGSLAERREQNKAYRKCRNRIIALQNLPCSAEFSVRVRADGVVCDGNYRTFVSSYSTQVHEAFASIVRAAEAAHEAFPGMSFSLIFSQAFRRIALAA